MEKENTKKKLLIKFFKAHTQALKNPEKNQDVEKIKKSFKDNGFFETEEELLKEAALLLQK